MGLNQGSIFPHKQRIFEVEYNSPPAGPVIYSEANNVGATGSYPLDRRFLSLNYLPNSQPST